MPVFKDQGTESGTGELFNYCMEMFAIEFCPFLNICASLALASEDSCLKVIERIKCLPVFTEYLENVDERDIIATQELCVWQSIKSKPVYGDNNLLIPEGTLGVVVKDADKNGASIIQWKVTVNGWQICLREMHIKLQEMAFSLAFPAPVSVQRIEAVGKLVLNILKTNLEMRFHLSHLINVLFSIFQRYINSSLPSLELVAMFLDIAGLLSKNMSDIWQQLAQMHVLPFLTNFSKNLSDLLSGIGMNVGIIGQLIASRECVSGEYTLCLAFLNVVSNVAQGAVDEDENFLACIVYILREIFSYFPKWYYVNPQERILIGQKCLNLLHSLFSVEKCRVQTVDKAQELCIFTLLHFEAGQTLLRIACTGEEVIQQTILKQNR
ncbi:nucleoporin NUP188 homolog [Stegodyphus dumicola]|uniref:nucleoporin NUP188 homolog n=1 Tax=Stegodyphus dumicola TaxID=202533 RepID=UPI0015A8A5B8|nr:nucleoporin NUP188 homolog [Stegodyphus dumicola]